MFGLSSRMKTCFYGNISTKYDLLIVLGDCSNVTFYLQLAHGQRAKGLTRDYNTLFTAYEYLDHENPATCFLVKL